MKSSDFKMHAGKKIPFGGEKSEKQPVFYFLRRLRNYLLFLLAYFAPSNKVRVALNRWKGVNIADGAYIGTAVFIDNMYPEYIYIEENASINAGSMLIAHFNPPQHFRGALLARVEPIVIKKGAICAIRSIINPGVTVGQYAIVAANSVVNEDVEAKTLVRGNPAVKVGKVKIKNQS
ncbi:MAG: acyltransferase [Prevotellaceae bacterium]|jgi:acetyltransferase-like isoleucine patch superfamily enzyme|nr:acyltransferase [Prevotellaceae bacterium]